MEEKHLIENGKRKKCPNCDGEDWVIRPVNKASAHCAKCDLIITFKPEQ